MHSIGTKILYGSFLIVLVSGLVYGNTTVMSVQTYNSVKMEKDVEGLLRR